MKRPKEYPASRFNEENAAKAFSDIAAHQDFDLVRWTLLRRYAEVRQLFFSTDPNVVNRAVGKMEEIEQVLALFGEPLYGGLPLADGTSADEIALADLGINTEIGGGYPGSFRQSTPVVNPGVASGS